MAAPPGNPGPAPFELPSLFNPPTTTTGTIVPPMSSGPPGTYSYLPYPGARLMQLLDAPTPPSTSSGPLARVGTKAPRGRLLLPPLGDSRCVHDVDSAGEARPPQQLEVTPITKYTSDPGLVLGRQIAVNRAYIVYGLKQGNIRVLNINSALRSLLRGHTQRVTDMAFFAEDVHRLASASVDGRIYVWKIDEGPDEENKPQITGKVEIAIQIVGDAETYHPRICWHSHKQEILFVGIGNCVLRIDTTKVGRGRDFTGEEPLQCTLDKLIDGIHLVGKHDGDVTDLSLSQWMTTRLASASADGTVKIWDDRRAVPLSVIIPHDGKAVYSVSFLTAPEQPSHINLVTAGPLNQEVKIWASSEAEGWLLPSDSETWRCTQTLELVSSLEHKVEEAFFNQVAVLPRASLILLANAKKNAIYAVHVEYGTDPASTRLDYIADFTVAMPILSLTGTHESKPDGEQVVQVYCVQTMAIQQYGLELSLCLPPTADNTGLGRDPASSHVYERPLEVASVESFPGTKPSSDHQVTEADITATVPPLTPTSSMDNAGSYAAAVLRRDPSTGPPLGQSSFDYSSKKMMDSDGTNGQGALGRNDSTGKQEPRGQGETTAKGSPDNVEVESKHVVEKNPDQIVDVEPVKETQIVHEKMDKLNKSWEQNVETISERSVTTDKYSLEDSHQSDPMLLKQHSGAGEEDGRRRTTDVPKKTDGSGASRNLQSPAPTKEEKVLHPQVSGQLSPLTSTFNSTDSPPSNSNPGIDSVPQVAAIQGALQQLMATHTDMQKQLNTIVSAPIAKEGKRIETSLGRNLEKSMKANVDAMWARFQEENARHEKAEKERMQQFVTLITTSANKDIPAMLDKSLKKEISSLGATVARTTAPIIEKSLSSAVSDSLQKVLGEKVVNQLDKSVTTKLEATVTKQIQTQFQTSAKQALQDALRSGFESSIIPAFEQSCKTMFEQVDGAFQKGMSEHGAAIQQQVAGGHTPLAQALRETITSASSITQGLTSELLDGQRKLLALVASGNPVPHNTTSVLQPANGPVPSLPKVDVPLDPVKELSRLISERKFDEAFTMALHRNDLSLVSWLCSQVDLQGLCGLYPVPLNQGVLLALFQQLACDIGNNTSLKLRWMRAVAMAIQPMDQMIATHLRPVFEQVYAVLAHLPTASPLEANDIRLMMHVINSVLLSYK